ncbi:hypothetical protein SPRG_08247 [Saprolegnia parasitica CBS 223.65]|uniref:J domain-containing protein n=1 Tax=Saprolegnia parasitica (strain CBS 223.65) TaxID=695850 RepID=A0A067C6N1_SAPPC|nr:hypothetical protein SPRG_08247 [Saprolegnia parasitica CBS 223.65]KDO26444.1 hypothetical protein SPRG_08247 [Saprolegnia parasitica CBS 223.65]|eukprot:XP_012202880.1 hypothetical protein SPRG_08247 [Saprolegnia parasitica CBS 223.65]
MAYRPATPCLPLPKMSPEELTFTLVLVSLYVVPATFFVLRRLFKDPRGCWSKYFALHLLCLLVSYVLVVELYRVIAASSVPTFDPYDILGIREYSTKKTIRKAYRALSKQFHPDKQLGDSLAASKFALIAKAYEALTDPVAIKNFKKFGHPDGPSFHLIDFKAMSGQAGMTIIALVYGSMALLGVAIAMLSGDKYKPEVHMENMSAFEILNRCIREVKQPLAEKAGGDCCGGGGSLYEMDAEVVAFLDLLESNQVISTLEHRDIARIDQDHVKRDMVALYYFLNERKAKELELTVPCALHTRITDIVLQLPYLIEVFVEFSIKVAAEKKSDATTVLTALRLLPALAQGSLTVDAAAIAAQRQRLTTGGKVPSLKLNNVALRVDDETDVFPRDWVTLHLQLERSHVAVGATAPLAGTLYDKKSKNHVYRRDHAWVVLQNASTHHLLGAWKIEDGHHAVTDALGFWAPPIVGDVLMDLRVLSTVYLDTECHESLRMKVVSANAVIEEITSDDDA